MTLQRTGGKTPEGARGALFPFEGGGVSGPFPEAVTFCLKSAKASKGSEQEAEPSYAFRGSGSLGRAGGLALWRRGWGLVGGGAAFSVATPTPSLRVSPGFPGTLDKAS